MLESEEGAAAVATRIQQYHEMGVTAVPVLVIDDRQVLPGAPDPPSLTKILLDLKGGTSPQA